MTNDMLLHVGGSVRYQRPNDAIAASNNRVLAPGSNVVRHVAYCGYPLALGIWYASTRFS